MVLHSGIRKPLEDDALKTVVIGGGNYAVELVDLVGADPALELVGVLDPDDSLRGCKIGNGEVLGWLADLPCDAEAAVIGLPHHARSFDREAVYFLLLQKGLAMPAVISEKASVDGAEIGRGCVVIDGAAVADDATVGENVLLGRDCRIHAGTTVADHTIIPSGHIVDSERVPRHEDPLGAIVVGVDETLGSVIQRINWACMEIILVVDAQGVLLGTVTDGDIRRGILAGISLQDPVSIIMNSSPITVNSNLPRAQMLKLMRTHSIRHLPVVDAVGRPERLERMEQLIDGTPGQAVVMAGGLGSRLKPFTNHTPKPLVTVGGRAILDHTLSGLRNSGVEDVVISLNHMGDQIKRHVGTGDRRDLRVDYVTETRRLGTAGALALLDPRPQDPFVVMNGDLMTELNFARLFEFQREGGYDMVLCVRQHAIQIPYGVVEMEEGVFKSLREKPNIESFINAGIYVLKPSCIDQVPADCYFDMTQLIDAVRQAGGHIGIFPIIEYWRDIGRPEDLAAAHVEHEERIVNFTDCSVSVPMENIA